MVRLKRVLKSVLNKRAKIRAKITSVLITIILLVLIHFRKVLYLRYYALVNLDRDAIIKQESRDFTASIVKYTSKCKCRENVTVTLVKTPKTYVIEIEDKQQTGEESIKKSYIVSRKEFEESIFSCDMYNTLRRGPNQRIISYSLYGQDRKYYERIKGIVIAIRSKYPGWIVRVSHDSTIDTEFICEMECLTYEGSYLDIIDFCDMERLPIDPVNTLNVSYMHGMTYRWISMGDDFIDFVASRDTDAWISQREIDSVNVWLNSNTIFHVMRDDPMHDIPIVGGYWGFANSRDRQLSKHLFKILTNKFIAEYFNPGDKNLKGEDQFLLTEFFSPYSLKNSTTHDAFSCDKINGDPWPTKRSWEFCFVGCSVCCDQPEYVNKVPYHIICPVSCRPKNHQDWIHC